VCLLEVVKVTSGKMMEEKGRFFSNGPGRLSFWENQEAISLWVKALEPAEVLRLKTNS
jgi:hypothetical protein